MVDHSPSTEIYSEMKFCAKEWLEKGTEFSISLEVPTDTKKEASRWRIATC